MNKKDQLAMRVANWQKTITSKLSLSLRNGGSQMWGIALIFSIISVKKLLDVNRTITRYREKTKEYEERYQYEIKNSKKPPIQY